MRTDANEAETVGEHLKYVSRLEKALDASEARASLLAAVSYVPQKVCSTRSCSAGGSSYQAKAG